jgi:hypothetical protein
MKTRFLFATVLLASFLIFISINVAQAQWNALNSGYAVTTDWHGLDVPLGQLVTATAGTTNPQVKSVEFIWIRPDGTVAWIVISETLLTSPYPPPNVPQEVIDYNSPKTIWYTQDAQTPDELGDWTVKAIFHIRGNKMCTHRDIVRCRATSFFVIPEAPLGVLATILSIFGALGASSIKRKKP